jgi:hypothetical protein
MTYYPIVIWRRDASGAVASVEMWQGDALAYSTAHDPEPYEALANLLHNAREHYRADPHDRDALPPDYAIVAAWEEYLS